MEAYNISVTAKEKEPFLEAKSNVLQKTFRKISYNYCFLDLKHKNITKRGKIITTLKPTSI
jgi:hypothetical protein